MHAAIRTNDLAEVVRLLEDPNAPIYIYSSMINEVCDKGKIDILNEMLKHPQIELGDHSGRNVLSHACASAPLAIVKILLTSPAHAYLNQPGFYVGSKFDSYTPLGEAILYGRADVVKLLLEEGADPMDAGHNPLSHIHRACGSEDLTILKLLMIYSDPNELQPEARKVFKKTSSLSEVEKDLWKRYIAAPHATQQALREELLTCAASVFALVVFRSDGYLTFTRFPKLHPRIAPKVKRFLHIAAALPMDLQMVLCQRVAGSAKNNIASKDLEPELKRVVAKFI